MLQKQTYQSFSLMCDGGEASCPADESSVLEEEEIAEPVTLFGTREAPAAPEEGEPGVVVMRKKKPHLPSARERNRNSGILSIVQNSSTSTNSSDEEDSGKKQHHGDDDPGSSAGADVNIKEYKPLIEFVDDD